MPNIGIFDSGLGGRFTYEHAKKMFPEYDYELFLDRDNAPYGDKSHEQILELTEKGVLHLFDKGVDMVILACNTASSDALKILQQKYPNRTILGCIIPSAEKSVEISQQVSNPKIGLMATNHTVKMGKYIQEIHKINADLNIVSIATPELVPLIENNEIEKCQPIWHSAVNDLVEKGVNILILGCTHYSILKEQIQKTFPNLQIVDSSFTQAQKLGEYIQKHFENNDKLTKFVQINKEFYKEVGSKVWNQNPNYYWMGWDTMLDNIKQNDLLNLQKGLKVLDIGCGNGRFLNFLTERGVKVQKYVGLDNSEDMLEVAKENVLQSNPNSFELVCSDLIEGNWQKDLIKIIGEEKFDLIVAFGVFHHVPSTVLRHRIFEEIKDFLETDGLFVWTSWRFLDLPRLAKRVLDFNSEILQNVLLKFGLTKVDLEPGDYVLDWIKLKTAYRYSHYFDESEIKSLTKSFVIENQFLDDDRQRNRNGYFLCKIKNDY